MNKLIIGMMLLVSQLAQGADCTIAQKQDILSTSTKEVYLSCNLILDNTDVVTRNIFITKSDVSVMCNRGILAGVTIKSPFIKSEFNEIHNITIKKCELLGQLRILGHSRNGEDINNVNLSKNINHTEYSQRIAPHHITLESNVFNAKNTIAIYLAPGVNNVTVKNSTIRGTSVSTAIYLDAESGYNTISNNAIYTVTERELIAIDGSANNTITGNKFSSLEHGGIYLYRNCGQNGAVRHQTPSFNIISGNQFYYKNCTPLTCAPSIWVSSRNQGLVPILGYCGEDKGVFKTGKTSSTDNNDNAEGNKIFSNTFVNATPVFMIQDTEFNYKNLIYGNIEK